MKVWIINASDYESYGFIVQGVYSTKRKALLQARKILKEHYGKTNEEISQHKESLPDGYVSFIFDDAIVDLWEIEMDKGAVE